MVPTGGAALERLDVETRSKLRSTQILTALPQIISELVQNSLDAGGKHIDIGVNYEEWSCWVRDDGAGMSRSGLELIAQGAEKGRYTTSKAYNTTSLDHVKTFGFRGEALASAADLSLLEISSRTARSKECWSILLKGGEKLYFGPAVRWQRERAGTTVSIRDAFYNLPIRRLSHPSAPRTKELIRRELEALALMFPEVAFTLEDTAKERREGPGKGRLMTIPKTSSTVAAFRHLFGRALVEHVDEIESEMGSLKFEGFISLVGAHSKAHQFLCELLSDSDHYTKASKLADIVVNRHILDPCDLHRLIDQKFQVSSFAKHAFDETGETVPPRSNARRSPRKGERRPIYVINITVPPHRVDSCLEPAKAAVQLHDQKQIVSMLADVIKSFLVKHGFSNTRVDTPKLKSNYLINGREFDMHDEMAVDVGASYVSTSKVQMDSSRKRAEGKEIIISEKKPVGVEEDSEDLTWVDPVTCRTYVIDPRSGNSYVKDERSGDVDHYEDRLRSARRTIDGTGWLKRTQDRCNREQEGKGAMPDWIRQALQGNDVFSPTEPSIPAIPSTAPYNDFNNNEGKGKQRTLCFETSKTPYSVHGVSLDGATKTPSYSFTKETLLGAEVIEQVDKKFVACLIDSETSINDTSNDDNIIGASAHSSNMRTLVLVDQHAADERIRVERYLKALCLGFLNREGVGVEKRLLDPPIPVLLTRAEQRQILGSSLIKRAFRNWGLEFIDTRTSEEAYSDVDYGLVHLRSVPEVVADKLLGGDDLRELIKGYLARLDSEGSDDAIRRQERYARDIMLQSEPDDFAWLKVLRLCPRELVDLVNSKACRGAIMFNDQLTMEQCRRLMRQLSMTALPFQCAHGRPSVVPLTTICSPSGQAKHVDWSRLDVGDDVDSVGDV